MRRLALFVLKDYKERIILQHRSSFEDSLPNYWAFFGGEMESGETPDQAVRREAKEELGIELENLKFFKKFQGEEHISYLFTAKLNRDIDQLRSQQREGDDLDLFDFEDVHKLRIADFDMVKIRELFGV